MASSIMPHNLKGVCYVCKAHCDTQEHHIFEGANRAASERTGLKCDLCPVCHRRAHEHPEAFENLTHLKRDAQRLAMEYYGWTVDDFRERFRKDYT